MACRKKTPFSRLLQTLSLHCLLIVYVLSAARGQSIGGRIIGTVTDSQGAVIPGAAVTVTHEGTGAQRQTITNDTGLYVVPELPVGFYTVRIEAGHLAPATQPAVKVAVGHDARVDAVLTPLGIEQTVHVSAEAPLLQADSSALSQWVSRRQADLLPINGRDYRRLTILVPGAAPRSQRGSLGSFTVNGQREKANIFLIDGVDNNDSFRNQPSFNQGGVTGAPATLFPVDALDEFSIQTQGGAEYGRNSGAIVDIVVKSGSNDFHGSVYDFLRNDNLDARNFFETVKNEFRNNNFGGVVGGPILRNRAFFFAGYEGQREFVTSPFVVRVPSPDDIAAARAVNAAAGLAENPLSARLLRLFPAPSRNAASGNNYAFVAPNVNNSDNFVVKLDRDFGEALHLSGRYIFGDGVQNFPLTSGFGSPLAAYQTVVPTRIQLVGLNATQILGSRWIHEVRLGYNRFVQRFTPLDENFDPAGELGLATGSGLKSLPTITVSGFVSLGAPTNVPRGRVSSAYQFVDNLTWTRGSHVYKVGGEYRRAIVNSYNDNLARGRLNFAGLADFLAGKVSASGTALLRGATRRDTFTNGLGLFAQDDWKATRRLTLNLGLRYEYLGVFTEQFGRLSNFLPDRGLVPVGDSGLSQLYEPDHNNFGPRAGFAYDLTGSGKTILRGSYGMYYDTPSQDYFLLQGFANGGPASPATNPLAGLGTFTVSFPATATIPFSANVPIFGTATGSLPTSNLAVFAVDRHLRTPYIHNYNLNIQQELHEGMVLQAGYVGSRGTKLFRVRDINQAAPGPAVTRQSRRPFNTPFPQLSFINYLETSANSNYNALQLHLKQRMHEALSWDVAYTWAKSIDDASNGIFSGIRGVAFPQNSFNLRAERAVSSYDVRHRLTVNFVYELAFLSRWLPDWPAGLTQGWQLGGVYTGSSGLPITPFLSQDVSGTGELNDRPNLTGRSDAGAAAAPNRWFNTAAFARPADGTFGNAGRNSVIGPSLHVADFSLGKLVKLADRVSIQFRAEFFNLFNRANLSLPDVDFVSAAFGAVSETPDVSAGNPRLGEGGPRVIQFGLKLLF